MKLDRAAIIYRGRMPLHKLGIGRFPERATGLAEARLRDRKGGPPAAFKSTDMQHGP
jgi:hypothetical protein